MIDGAPQLVRLAADLHEDLIQMPAPLWNLTHKRGPLQSDFAGEHRTKAIDPEQDAFVTDVDTALMQQVFNIAQRERESNVHHHCKLDDFGRCFEVAKRVFVRFRRLEQSAIRLKSAVALTMPLRLSRRSGWLKPDWSDDTIPVGAGQ